ncbi:hypothetical protein Acr_00g0003210 [Actinidia rufa]|uniref:Uncharacterized protein n=1 Tax=Actinidia rufa TaxID=165716 RepID=A0A7J0D760_9ERIC|nr:hypothetical protein Acr_00g0003210 [Actinidia rufa]
MYSRAEEEMESSDSDVQRGVGPKNFRSLLGEMKDTGSCPGSGHFEGQAPIHALTISFPSLKLRKLSPLWTEDSLPYFDGSFDSTIPPTSSGAGEWEVGDPCIFQFGWAWLRSRQPGVKDRELCNACSNTMTGKESIRVSVLRLTYTGRAPTTHFRRSISLALFVLRPQRQDCTMESDTGPIVRHNPKGDHISVPPTAPSLALLENPATPARSDRLPSTVQRDLFSITASSWLDLSSPTTETRIKGSAGGE